MTLPRNLSLLLLAVTLVSCGGDDSSTSEEVTESSTAVTKAVYVLSNSSTANEVLTYARGNDGSLSFSEATATGDSGTGGELDGVCKSLTYDPFYGVLYAVNGGSNSVSAFYIQTDGTLTLLDTENSRGVRPVSVAVAGDVVYVVNQGNADNPANVAGFRLVGGDLTLIDDSVQPLSTDQPEPVQIDFTSTPNVIVVSEKATNSITSFPLDSNRAAYGRNTQPSLGLSPGGFDFTPAGVMVVAEGQQDSPNSGSASSYVVGGDGTLVTVSEQVANSQTGSANALVLSNALFAFVANPGSDTISTYSLDVNGALSSQGGAVASLAAPVDLAVSDDEAYLYSLNRGNDSISIFSLDRHNGHLIQQTTISGLPSSAIGLAAR